ncbi:MAG: hypothetical protein IKH30_08955 [Clostridia bacterium]|nr:hypothetical protein [Clostridia bacterium]
MRDMVLVLNFDDFAARAVTRKLRSERIFCKIVPGNIPLEAIQAQEPLGLLLAGGVTGRTPSGLDGRISSAGIPILALGDTAGLLLEALGGKVGEPVLQGAVMELSYQESPLLTDLENNERLLPCARDMQLPSWIKPICFAQETVVGFAHETRPLYGMQFEVEQNDPEGSMMMRNFAFNICGCTAWWDEDAFVSRATEEISRLVGGGRAVCAMTGGLNSGLSAMLAYKALGDRLKCIFVDTGLLREREGDDFIAYYRDEVGMDITRVNAGDRFLDALKNVTRAEEKSRIISETIFSILREEEAKLGGFNAVIRGTSCSDVLFGKQPAAPAIGADALLIEPVRDLFKEEIRAIADFLGMPQEIISRQPFPGSGLALRILGEVTEDRLRTLRAADAVFQSELVRSGAAKRLWQYFAVLLPLPENERKYAICLRAVHASERSQAYAARLPYDVMENVVDLILRDLPQVGRIVYDLTPSANYSGVEWE